MFTEDLLRIICEGEVVNLSHQQFDDGDWGKLQVNLAQNKNLKELRLDNTGLDNQHLESLVITIQNHSALELLSFSGNRISVSGLTRLCNELINGYNSVTSLYLDGNLLGNKSF